MKRNIIIFILLVIFTGVSFADVVVPPPPINIDISSSEFEALEPNKFRIRNLTAPAYPGVYWVDFLWNSNELIFQPTALDNDNAVGVNGDIDMYTTAEVVIPPPPIEIDISNSYFEVLAPNKFRIRNLSAPSYPGVYRADFLWDQNELIFQPIGVEVDTYIDFTGVYNFSDQYDLNISNGVALGIGTVTLDIMQIDSNNLNVQISGNNPDEGSYFGQFPLVVSGNTATLITHPYDMLLELLLLSDGNNMVYTGIGQETNNPADISISVGNWLKNPLPVTIDSFVGTWSGFSYSDPNLLNTTDGFNLKIHESVTISRVDSDTISIDMKNELISLAVANGRATLNNAPVTTPSGAVYHAVSIVTDGSGLSSYIVATELNDPTDVSVSIGLMTKQ